MGIQVEFNPDLALRKYKATRRLKDECLPKEIIEGEIHEFLKKGQRNYWFGGELPLVETKGNENLSKPLASILILESTHFLINNEVWTKGTYKIIHKIEPSEIYFNGFNKVIK